jgi:hypothetical protein
MLTDQEMMERKCKSVMKASISAHGFQHERPVLKA